MNQREKKSKVPDEGAPAWMTSYGDLMTNLLCCFVLLFSFAIVDKQKFADVAKSVRSAFPSNRVSIFDQSSGDTMLDITPYESPSKDAKKSEDSADGNKQDVGENNRTGKGKPTALTAKADIEELVKKAGLTENIKVIEEKDIITFRIDSNILFDSGKADLKDEAKPVLKEIGLKLKELEIDIIVQGHADDRPINTMLFPSNWELSTKRATNVVKYMISTCNIEPKYLTATGNAEFKPIAPNDTEYNRQKNRRIDIIIAK